MRLILFTEQSLCRVCLELLCERFAANATVLSVSSLDEVVALVQGDERVDLVLYSQICPQSKKLDTIELLCRNLGDIPVVLHVCVEEEHYVERAKSSGIKGVLSTSTKPELAIAVLTLIAAGGTYFPSFAQAEMGGWYAASTLRPVSGLSKRQWEVLRRIREGKTNRAIGEELGISEHTVKVHVRRIMRQFGINSRIKLALATDPTPQM